LTLNWRPPLYADGTVNHYGTTFKEYRVRWQRNQYDAWLNPAGKDGEIIAISDANSAALRSYNIGGLVNGFTYRVEFWLLTNRDQSAVDAYLNGIPRAVNLRAAGRSLAPRVGLLGTPHSAPALNELQLGARVLTLQASWVAPSEVVSAYQLRWRPFIAGDSGLKGWQVAGVAAGQLAYTISEYARDDPAMRDLREIEYEAQVRTRFADGVWSDWSASRRIIPPDPRLRGMLLEAAVMQDGNPAFLSLNGSPRFAGGTFSYEFTAPYAASAVHLTPRAAAGRSITIGVRGGSANAVNSASRSAAIVPGAPGSRTVVEVRVAATRGALRSNVTYLYVLKRNAAPPPTPGLPEPPSNVRTLPGTQDLGLVWGAPGDGQSYSAYRVRWRTLGMPAVGRTPGQAAGDWQPEAGGGGARLTRYTISGLTTGTTYEAQVRAVNSLGNAGYWSQPVQAAPREFVFDVDASGGDADGTDATYIARYLLGLRGEAVTAGFNVSAAQTESIIAGIVVGLISNEYDVDNSGATTAADGIMIMRYLLGVTGAALTAGQSIAAPADVQTAIDNLQP